MAIKFDKRPCYHGVMSRVGRKPVAWLCLSALLFLQLAVAAHACPAPIDRNSSIAAATSIDGSPCRGMDQESPKLCEQHCVHDSQSVDTQPHSAVNLPLSPPLVLVVKPDYSFATAPHIGGTSLAAAFGPPPLVRFGVLRI
jgi:hypothetical protein